jgi:protein involved in polysaccharide export with SLBB domain
MRLHPPSTFNTHAAAGCRRAIVLLLCAGLTLAVFGCAQNAAYAPAPAGIGQAKGPASGAKTVAVVIADLDNDGMADIVSGSVDPGVITISYGEGSGRFTTPRLLPVEGDVRSIAVADVNEDGLPDLIYSVQRQSSGIRVLLNQTGRRWTAGKGPTEINKYEGLRAADLNGDGHIDIVAANAAFDLQGGLQVWWGTGDGNWVPGLSPSVTGTYMDVAVADLNGDGVLDLAGAGWGTHGALRVWLGDGGGRWRAVDPVTSGNFYALNVADLNNDGHLDLVAGSYKTGVRLFYGNGRGGFEEKMRLKALRPEEASTEAAGTQTLDSPERETSFWQALPVDLNGDGWMDIVAGSLDYQGVYSWLNQAGKGWKPHAPDFPRSGNFYGFAAANLNADGRPDLCAANWGEGVVILNGRVEASAAAGRAPRVIAGRAVPAAAVIPPENDVFKIVDGTPEYKIGPGDLLEITLWEGNTATRQDLLVRPNGQISFGLVENLKVSGLTAGELDSRLSAKLEQYFKRPRVDVRVKQYNSKSVRLLGALVKTGASGSGAGEYKLQGKATVLEMLTAVGGPTSDADLKSVRIRRKDGETVSLNLYKTIIQGDLSQDMVLNDGDLIYVPTLSKEANRVYVFGEVQKPGAYTFSGSEMRLIDAISEAGGTTPFAYRTDTKVVRGDITQPEILSADLGRLIERGDRSQNLLLASGDMVYVPRSGFGDIKLFYDQVRPLLEMVLWPARVVIDWNSAADITGVK